MRRTSLAAGLAALALAVSACADGGEPFVAPQASSPIAGSPQLPSRQVLERVAGAVNLRPADLPGFDGTDVIVVDDPARDRVDEQLGTCLGLGEALGRGAVRSESFRDGEVPPFVQWSSEVSRHDARATPRAVRAFGAAAGPRCWRPVVDQLLRASLAAQPGTTATQVRLTAFPVDAGAADAAAGVRASALLQGTQSTVEFGLDLVLVSEGGLLVSLYGNAFGQQAPVGQRDALVRRLASRLAASAARP